MQKLGPDVSVVKSNRTLPKMHDRLTRGTERPNIQHGGENLVGVGGKTAHIWNYCTVCCKTRFCSISLQVQMFYKITIDVPVIL